MDIVNNQGGQTLPSATDRFSAPVNNVAPNIDPNMAQAQVPVNSIAPAGVWICPKCGENNLESNRYCRKCGFENVVSSVNFNNQNSGYVEQKSGIWKWILVIFIILALAGGGVIGWYYWNLNKQKKEAGIFLTNESKAFNNTIILVNDLSTEKKLSYKDSESKEVFLKKLEEEKIKSEKALAEIKTTREKNGKAVANTMASGTDALLKQYYQEAEEKISMYNSYTTYQYDVMKLEIATDKEMDKIDAIFKSTKDPKTMVKALRDTQTAMQALLTQYKAVTIPAGLEEAHNKDMAILEKFINSLGVVANGLDKLSLAEIKRGDDMMDEAFSDKNLDEIYQLREYYMDELHKKISDLRSKADNIKTEFIKTGAGLNAEIAPITIEGW